MVFIAPENRTPQSSKEMGGRVTVRAVEWDVWQRDVGCTAMYVVAWATTGTALVYATPRSAPPGEGG